MVHPRKQDPCASLRTSFGVARAERAIIDPGGDFGLKACPRNAGHFFQIARDAPSVLFR